MPYCIEKRTSVGNFNSTVSNGLDALSREIEADEGLAKIQFVLLCEETRYLSYSMDGQQLLYQGRFVLLRTSLHIPRLLQEFHGSII